MQSAGGRTTYERAKPGAQTKPGLIIFRYDAELFYANASRFVDEVEVVFASAPDPVRWLVLDCSSVTDIDYSAAISVKGLIDYVHAKGGHFGVMGADPGLLQTMAELGLSKDFAQDRNFGDYDDVVAAFREEAEQP